MRINTEPLEKIGLTKGESKVYLALLKKGMISAGPLTKESKISRSKVYEITDRLVEKGLASFISENGIKKFKAIDPKLIPDYLEKQKDLIELQKVDFNKILPTLMMQIKYNEKEQSVEVFEGWKGMKNIFNNLIKDAKKGDKWYAFGMPKTMSKERLIFFSKWRKQTDKIGIHQYLIANEEIRNSEELAPKSRYSNIRYLNQETPTTVDIFKKFTILIIWSEKPILILVKSQQVSESFMKFFDNIWKQARE